MVGCAFYIPPLVAMQERSLGSSLPLCVKYSYGTTKDGIFKKMSSKCWHSGRYIAPPVRKRISKFYKDQIYLKMLPIRTNAQHTFVILCTV